jgi:hypothetical protein
LHGSRRVGSTHVPRIFTKASVFWAIPEAAYLVILQDRNLGIAHVMVQEGFAYLLVTYGLITVSNLEANYSNIVAPFNFAEPIEMIFSRLECRKRYVTDGRDPFTLIQLRTIALQQII